MDSDTVTSRPNRDSEVRIYTWTCPICGASNVGTAKTENPMLEGEQAVKSHIRALSGNGHGPKYTVPKKWTANDLRNHIEISE